MQTGGTYALDLGARAGATRLYSLERRAERFFAFVHLNNTNPTLLMVQKQSYSIKLSACKCF